MTKITPDALKEQLKAEGVTVQTLEELSYAGLPYTDAYHYAFAISGFDHLMALPSFQDGLFYVQDISSMMVAEAAAPEKGAHVIDVCAAPGGKSIHLAEMLDGTGSVESRDLTGYKTGLIEENISRYQIKNMTTKVWDATVPDESAEDTADVLVADLPCSGLGVLRKKTDIRYKMSRGQQEELEALQRRILDTVCSYVKKDGIMVYSTCTINPGENQENVAWFLGKHPEFELLDMEQIYPGTQVVDGFFYARLRRIS